jgi:hypothetical protein
MFIDDFELNVVGTGTGQAENTERKTSVEIFPNPMVNSTRILITGLLSNEFEISIYTSTGVLVDKKEITTSLQNYTHEFYSQGLKEGVYYCVVRMGNDVQVKKVTVVR